MVGQVMVNNHIFQPHNGNRDLNEGEITTYTFATAYFRSSSRHRYRYRSLGVTYGEHTLQRDQAVTQG